MFTMTAIELLALFWLLKQLPFALSPWPSASLRIAGSPLPSSPSTAQLYPHMQNMTLDARSVARPSAGRISSDRNPAAGLLRGLHLGSISEMTLAGSPRSITFSIC